MIYNNAASGGSNERADVARRIVGLTETIAEAIDYMLAQFEAAHMDLDMDMGIPAILIKDAGDGLISLENAVSAIAEPAGLGADDIRKLDRHFGELTERLDMLVDACVGYRAAELPALGAALRDSFVEYEGVISRCFRKMTVM